MKTTASKTFLFVLVLHFVPFVLPGKSHALRQVEEHWSIKENTEPDKEVVAAYFENLFKKGDFAAIAKIIAKDAVYNQAEGLPYGGTYVGFEQWMTMFQKAQTFFDLQITKEPTYYTSEADRGGVIIHFTIRCISKKTKKEITMPISEYFVVKDGLIVSIRPFYFDTKAFAEFLN
jgi:ketosteroid isomerase-like protein